MVITSAEDVTANLVIEALNERRVLVARVDPADIGSDLLFNAHMGGREKQWSGRLRTPSRDIALEQIRAVYYRRPSPWRFKDLEPHARDFAIAEARHGLSGLLANLPNCRYVNHPVSITRSDFKPAQLQVAAGVGFKVPVTLVSNDLEAIRKFVVEHEPAVYKSFRGAPATSEGHVAAIWTQRAAPEDLDESVSMTAHLFQQEVDKVADARVTVIGSQVFASRITTPDGALDWRAGDWDKLIHEPIDVPETVKDPLHAYLDHFGLVFGCFDFVLEAGDERNSAAWTFIECNPNGQWGWLPGSEAMAGAFAEAILRGWWP
ncbi:ATP-grasp ribosomal peptide maturase [Sphaerisporangium melleum]|uniref:ATP-grasp ribosomal peptide maturase n=1 Tax=Sphaerisporangium melleum TaxID=321316 RepID=A0A917QX01_9ACTN|nr:ATP-grasp ribosomal peptide maturase [Sphaerisporangium melleum]GGK73820.1 ATP-grasp ribosomal peptide maturase [Sphaerisporangium melleum]GII70835.1 ATP-grasp ribosomal peptide maturase [Sphaerisporangium melleum]